MVTCTRKVTQYPVEHLSINHHLPCLLRSQGESCNIFRTEQMVSIREFKQYSSRSVPDALDLPSKLGFQTALSWPGRVVGFHVPKLHRSVPCQACNICLKYRNSSWEIIEYHVQIKYQKNTYVNVCIYIYKYIYIYTHTYLYIYISYTLDVYMYTDEQMYVDTAWTLSHAESTSYVHNFRSRLSTAANFRTRSSARTRSVMSLSSTATPWCKKGDICLHMYV